MGWAERVVLYRMMIFLKFDIKDPWVQIRVVDLIFIFYSGNIFSKIFNKFAWVQNSSV